MRHRPLPVLFWQIKALERGLERKKWRLKPLFASWTPLQNSQREGAPGLAGQGQGAERKGYPEFLLPWKRRMPALFLSSPSDLSSFGLQLPRPDFQPSLPRLLSPRKTPQLQTQVKQIFVAASKFQRLFIARLSAPGAKSCC